VRTLIVAGSQVVFDIWIISFFWKGSVNDLKDRLISRPKVHEHKKPRRLLDHQSLDNLIAAAVES